MAAMESPHWVTLAAYPSAAEAEMLADRLAQANISAQVLHANANRMLPHMASTVEVTVQVPNESLNDAREVLASVEAQLAPGPADAPVENAAEKSLRLAFNCSVFALLVPVLPSLVAIFHLRRYFLCPRAERRSGFSFKVTATIVFIAIGFVAWIYFLMGYLNLLPPDPPTV